jgi:hypothetical protein
VCSIEEFRNGCNVGEGSMSGLETSRSAVPVRPTPVERMKPGLDRSIKYHRNGLTRARLMEACKVDAQGSLRCS